MKIVVLFERLQNVHLLKDVGMVPYLLAKEMGCDTEVVGYRNDVDYPYLKEPLSDLRVRFIGNRFVNRWQAYIWLWTNAREIDILTLFHICTPSIYHGLIYKFRNPGGYLYLKADLAGEQVGYARLFQIKNPLSGLKRWLLTKALVAKIDLVSVESNRSFQKVRAIPKEKIIHIPNGFWGWLADYYDVAPRLFAIKGNRILLVARHGDHAKNSELMLEALRLIPSSSLADWEIFFVGTATDAFRQEFSRFQADRSELANQVRLVGEIVDKKQLLELYAGSKLLILPSRTESFPLVCCEALYFGNALIMTREITSSVDLTDDERAGLVFNNENARDLAEKLVALISDSTKLKQMCEHAADYAGQHLVWETIVARLAARIQDDFNLRKQRDTT